MSGDLTGKFDYTSLIRTLRERGVQSTTSAAKKIGRDNDIDDIKNLDNKQEITIAQSIFDNAIQSKSSEKINPVTEISDGDLSETSEMGLIAGAKIMSDGESTMKLPEVYNDDDYEAVDYDDYYQFGEDETETETGAQSDESNETSAQGLDFENFKAQYGDQFATNPITGETENDTVLKNIFSTLDKDSNDYVDDAELASGLYSASLISGKKEDVKAPKKDDTENLISDDMMDMDMQNDSFSAK